jgi:hypothetical protein
MNSLFFQQVKAYRRSMTPAERKKKVKIKKVLYPVAKERAYARKVESMLLPIKQYVQSYIASRGSALLRGDCSDELLLRDIEIALNIDEIPSNELVLRLDAVPGSEFSEMQRQLEEWLKKYYPEEASPDILTELSGAAGVYAIQSKAFGSQAAEVVGYDYSGANLWWPDTRDQWMADNYKLIKSLSTEYITKVNLLTEKAILEGVDNKTLSKQIEGLSETMTKSRARLIARDQVGKLNGLIAHKQMLEAGVDMYIWQTAGDERVRGNPAGYLKKAVPSHWVMEGKLCRWDDATVYSEDGGKSWIPRSGKMPLTHPGMAIQCRCSAIPYFENIIQTADKSIKEVV